MSGHAAAILRPITRRQDWTLALDIGEASVGWLVGITDDEGNVRDILNAGVRLFESAWRNDAGTFKALGAEDRVVRGQERRHETRRTRLAALTRLFAAGTGAAPEDVKRHAVFHKGAAGRDPLEVFRKRARAVHEPLMPADLFRVLHHMTSHRGVRLAAAESADPFPTAESGHTERDEGVAKARGSERRFRQTMAANLRLDGSTPTCVEIMLAAVQAKREASGRRAQPVLRARRGIGGDGGALVPTRALIAEDFDRIRSVQEERHSALDWDAVRRLVVDQHPIAMPPAAPCLFLGELHKRGEPFDGRAIDPDEIARGVTNDPMMQAVRIREAVGNLRLGHEQDGPLRKVWIARSLEQEGLLHGELAAERDTLVDALMRLSGVVKPDARGHVTYPALRRLLGLDAKARFGIERDKDENGIKPNPTDPALALWIPGWFDHPLPARSLYYRALAERSADSRRLRNLLEAGAHGIGPVPADRLDAATATLLESDLFDSPLYSVCHTAAEAILAAWERQPTAGFYDLTRALFRFAPNEIVLEDLRRARACLHESLPYLAPRTPAARRGEPLKDYAEVIPSQLVTTLRRGHKGRGTAAPDVPIGGRRTARVPERRPAGTPAARTGWPSGWPRLRRIPSPYPHLPCRSHASFRAGSPSASLISTRSRGSGRAC